ncbi:hypothetical protein Tco_1328371 [Tanacetum coccineum]
MYNKEQAVAAIEDLNGKHKMEGPFTGQWLPPYNTTPTFPAFPVTEAVKLTLVNGLVGSGAATQTPSATRIETTPPAALCGSTITTLRDGTDEGEAHPDKCDDIHLLYALQET